MPDFLCVRVAGYYVLNISVLVSSASLRTCREVFSFYFSVFDFSLCPHRVSGGANSNAANISSLSLCVLILSEEVHALVVSALTCDLL